MRPTEALTAPTFRLAPMQLEDIDTVVAIEQQSFTTPWSRGMFLTELETTRGAHLLVARAGADRGEAVGYIGYRVVVDEMHVVILAVHPSWRRGGIARALLCEAMQQARQAACSKATLEVRASNTAAQRLYYRLGFAPVGVRPKYYTRPVEDALILWRDPL